MEELLSKKEKHNTVWKKITGGITVLAAIATILAFILPPKPDKNIENIRELLEEQKVISIGPVRPIITDSVLKTNPSIREVTDLQSEIIQYFRICDRLNFPLEKDLTYETKKIVCIQNLKIIFELGDISAKINNYVQTITLTDPSIGNYIDIPKLQKVTESSEQLNKALNKVNTEIDQTTNDKKIIKIIWEFFNSKELYRALKDKKDAYYSLLKTCEVVINKIK